MWTAWDDFFFHLECPRKIKNRMDLSPFISFTKPINFKYTEFKLPTAAAVVNVNVL